MLALDEHSSMRKWAVSIDQIAQLLFVAEDMTEKGESKMVVSSTRVASLAVGINAVRGQEGRRTRMGEILW